MIEELRRIASPGARIVAVTPVAPDFAGAPRGAALGAALARRFPSALSGLRPHDPTGEFERSGLTVTARRVVGRGYPSLCVLAIR